MYRLIIIDDEYEQVRGIKDYIDWNKYDIEVCGVAYNGRDGLALLKKQSPDIAIIDIQMPYLNGLSLIEKVNASGQNIQMIILSGHDNFEYAREAIHLKANNYLLKPCSIEEILQAVLCAKNLVADEQDKRNILSKYHSLFQTHKASLKENFLTNLLEDSLRSASTFFQDAARYDVNLTDDTCCITVFRFIDIDGLYSENTHEEFDHLLLSVLSDIKTHCLTLSHSELILYRDDIVLTVSGEESRNLFPLIQSIYQSLCDSYAFGFAVGIGQCVTSPLSAPISFHQALTALDNSIFLASEHIVAYDNAMLKDDYHYFYTFKSERKILALIETGDQSLVSACINDFFRVFETELTCDCMFTKKMGITLLSNIYKFCADRNIICKEINALIYKNFDEINAAKTLYALKEIIVSVLKDIITRISEHNQVNHLIKTAIDYIHHHYKDNINLKTAADELFITPAYLSVLFKQETRENFINYLNKFRIEQAKNLLQDIGMKNYQIAFETGFQDEKYFYKLFKKYTGLTPNQYRDSLSVNPQK